MKIEEIIRKSASIVIFFSFFGVILYVLLILQGIESIYYPRLSSFMFYFRSPVFLGGKARFDYIGFCLPLVISLLMIYPILRLKEKRIHWLGALILVIVLVGDLLYSLFIYELRPISSNGGGVNWLALLAVLIFIFYMILRGIGKQGVYLSFILGFLVGAISDLESLTHTAVATTYGAGGVFDADFILPLSMTFAYLFVVKLNRKLLLREQFKSISTEP